MRTIYELRVAHAQAHVEGLCACGLWYVPITRAERALNSTRPQHQPKKSGVEGNANPFPVS